jgi:hypothetical protein
MTSVPNKYEMAPDSVAAKCARTAEIAREAVTWLSDGANAATVGRERDALIREIRLGAIKAARMARAAERPMCVGVFGPSQAGKSYLVEVLARPENGALRAKFDGMEPLDFISQINPIGDKESTGLVTRFSSEAQSAAPAGFPVRLRLLTEIDIVKIMGNAFFLDGDQTKELPAPPEALSDCFARLEVRATSEKGHEAATEEDILDLQDYFQKQFSGARYIDALGRYWEHAQKLAPRLDLFGRSELFALLWGGHPAFTKLFVGLATAISSLGGAKEVFCPIEALTPREGSILDVATLAGLGGESADFLPIVAGQVRCQLRRPIVAALTAELRITLADQPRSFFERTDLLDFPGARSRQKVNLANFLAENPDALKETFLRGKVAYLFDRYVAEQELTSMLLCIRPSNQEVATLPDMIDAWIASTHGATPEARAAQANLLFLVLTWFDSHFVDKAGDAGQDAGQRFRNRLEASLLGYFGKAHAWPRQWTPGRPFQNCFWFRNPNIPAETIIRYEGRVEKEFHAEKQARIEELRRSFVSLPEVKDHFHDPDRAFSEALRLNDGGISYIVENLERVCRADLKLEQISHRLGELRRDIIAKLDRFYVPLDSGRRLEERRAAAGRVFDSLEKVVEAGQFGALLRMLSMDAGNLNDAIYRELRRNVTAERPKPSLASGLRVARPDQSRQSNGHAVQNEHSDRERQLARTAVEAWVAHLRGVAGSDVLARRMAISGEALKTIVDDLLGVMKRLDVEGQIAGDIKSLTTIERAEQSSAKIALIAAVRLNRLIGDFGFGQADEGKKPQVQDAGGTRVAFASRPIAYDASAITTPPPPFGQRFVTDWFHGFYRVVEDNAVSDGGLMVDLKQNERLGAILGSLAPQGAAQAGRK